MDTGIIGGVLKMPGFQALYGLDKISGTELANLSANLVTVMQAGAFAGALLANPLADRLGRKPTLMIVAVFAFIGGFLQAFAYGHLSAFYIGRWDNLELFGDEKTWR